MHVYQIECSSPEGGPCYELYHGEKFTEEQLDSMFSASAYDAMLEFYQNKLNPEYFYEGQTPGGEWPVSMDYIRICFDPLLDTVFYYIIEKMKDKFGFRSIIYTSTISYYGWDSILKDKYSETDMQNMRNNAKKALHRHLSDHPHIFNSIEKPPDWLKDIEEGNI